MPKGIYIRTEKNKHTEETKRKISLSRKGRCASEETKKKLKVCQFMRKSVGWLGDDANYFTKHHWIRDHYGNPECCVDCGKIGKLTGKIRPTWNIEWSNCDHKYRRTREDYNGRCRRCHIKYDKTVNGYL